MEVFSCDSVIISFPPPPPPSPFSSLASSLVTFDGPDGVNRAIELLSGREVEGRPLYIREDRTDIEQEEGFVVFVRGIKRGARGRAGIDSEEGEDRRRRLGCHCPHCRAASPFFTVYCPFFLSTPV